MDTAALVKPLTVAVTNMVPPCRHVSVLPETVAVEVETRFKVKEVDNGESKQGEDTSSKLPLVCTYYKLTMNGKELVEIDVLNMIEKVNGVDRLGQHRRNIGL